jgi:predicted HTH domain antitoxin
MKKIKLNEVKKITKQMNLRLEDKLIKEFEELAKHENLDRSSLIKKILIEGLQLERLNFAIQKYLLKEISLERAAEIAKISLHELILKVSQLGIPSNLTLEDFKKIL